MSNMRPANIANYNAELLRCLEELKSRREGVNKQILREEEDKAKIEREMAVLSDRLKKVDDSLQRKTIARAEYDKTIQEIEGAYSKILESSQTLLHVLKRESQTLAKKKGSNMLDMANV